MTNDFLHITDAEYLTDYMLKLKFSTGEVRVFDFSLVYDKGILVKLKDIDYFKHYTLDGWTVDWNNEIGFAPEFLYEHSKPAA